MEIAEKVKEIISQQLDVDLAEVKEAASFIDDLGADSIARVQWADVVEELSAADGRPVTVDDSALRAAVVLGDLADHLVPMSAGAPA